MFPIIFDQLAYETRVRFLEDPWEQKKYLVGIIKATAMYVREWMQDQQEENDVLCKDQLLASMSIGIWNQNITIANKIIETSSFAAKFLKVATSDDGISSSVSLIDSLCFLIFAIKPEHLLFPSLQMKTNYVLTAFPKQMLPPNLLG